MGHPGVVARLRRPPTTSAFRARGWGASLTTKDPRGARSRRGAGRKFGGSRPRIAERQMNYSLANDKPEARCAPMPPWLGQLKVAESSNSQVDACGGWPVRRSLTSAPSRSDTDALPNHEPRPAKYATRRRWIQLNIIVTKLGHTESWQGLGVIGRCHVPPSIILAARCSFLSCYYCYRMLRAEADTKLDATRGGEVCPPSSSSFSARGRPSPPHVRTKESYSGRHCAAESSRRCASACQNRSYS